MKNLLFKHLNKEDIKFLALTAVMVPILSVLGFMVFKGMYEVYGPYSLIPFYGLVVLHQMSKA